jgi:hypothetical protein
MRALFALLLLIAPAWASDLSVPDPALTPGVASDLTTEQICDKKWHTRDVRAVTTAMKKQVFTSYGETCRPLFGKANNLPRCGNFEVDHLISLELGGANDIKNLWPQPMKEARLKDKLEGKLHREVCAGNIVLQDAQNAIAFNWRIPYEHYFGKGD